MKKSLGAKTIALPLPAWVICTYDETGEANAMAASWTGICCSNPPCVYFAARQSRYTHACVTARRAFTVCIPGVDQAAATDYFGTVSGRKVAKLAAAGLSAVKAEHVDAPYIAEFPLVIECQLLQAHELGSHTMFIGKIVDVKCNNELLDSSGNLDATKVTPFSYSTVDGKYYAMAGAIGKAYVMGKGISERSRT